MKEKVLKTEVDTITETREEKYREQNVHRKRIEYMKQEKELRKKKETKQDNKRKKEEYIREKDFRNFY